MDELTLLRKIQSNLKELDFESNLLPQSETGSTDMLTVNFMNDNNEIKTLVISFMPLSNELEGSVFIQFYYEYPFLIKSPCPNELKTLVNNINRQLPLGHFNTNVAWSQIYMKYVMAASKENFLTTGQLSDIMDMFIYAIQHFEKDFSDFKMT